MSGGLFERDYMKRLIQQLAAVVARVLARARSEQNYAESLDELRQAGGELLGLDGRLLAAIDAASAAHLLRTSDKLALYAELCEREADLLEMAGDGAAAEARRRRAFALYQEALRRGRLRPEAEAARAALSARLGAASAHPKTP